MKTILLAALLFTSTLAFAETTAPFKISTIAVHQPGNLPFRVYGMPNIPSCPGGNFAYVDENDTTANAKISTLLTAFSAGKSIYLEVLPVTHPANGNTYCQIRVVFLPQ